MDPITQGVLGAVCAQTPAPRTRRLGWAVCGLLGGLAPDLDVLISSESDPLLFLEYHRQFSHALLFIPLGALLVAGFAYPLLRRWLDWRATYVACLVGYATHGLLDACTSYGTQLFWPLSDARIAWSVISVVDPLFTVPLIIGLIAALTSRRRLFRFAAVGWAIVYLLFGAWQHQRALAVADLLAGPVARDHGGNQSGEVERLMVKPSFGNLALWKSVHRQGDRYYVNAVRLIGAAQWCPGGSIRVLDVNRDLSGLVAGSPADRELARFRWFSNDYLASDGPGEVFDVRYSNVANEIDPLWGIRLDFDSAAAHPVQWWARRQVTPAHRDAFVALLRGEGCIPVP